MSRFLVTVLFAALAIYAVHAVEITPGTPTYSYDLREDSKQYLAEADYSHYEGAIKGALEGLFGTPQSPVYALTSEWLDEAIDPNSPQAELGDYGFGEIDEAEWELIIAGNQVRFADQLAAVAEERYDDVQIPSWMPDFADEWATWQEQEASGEYEAFESFQADMAYALENYYPSLRDASELYRVQCQHCHGNSGGGDGPTSEFLRPLPRDYRHGTFKFTALGDKSRPRREDLLTILHNGVTGTAMPSFARFSRAELNGLVDYVRLLSIRGEVEGLLVNDILNDYGLVHERVLEEYEFVWNRWQGTEANLIVAPGPVPDPHATYPGTDPADGIDYIEMGRRFFLDDQASDCGTCHGYDGRGFGSAAFEADGSGEWVKDDWGNEIQPRNFHGGVLRGGDRPIDVYRRIYAGINGTPMPGHTEYEPDKIWALVHFVRALGRYDDAHAEGRLILGSATDPTEVHPDDHGDHDDAGH